MNKVLSIDAWRSSDGGWEWNNWFTVGEIPVLPASNRKLLRILRDEGYLSDQSKGRVCVNDDGYNVVICDRNTGEPIYAIEYGNKE